MDLLLLDKKFQICGIIDDFSSLVWNRKYYECGNFSLQTSINNIEQFKNAVYVYCKEFEETAILETFDKKDTITGTEINRTGRFLESKLASRAIDNTQYFRNTITEDIIRSLVNTFVINAGNRTIPNIKLGKRKGLGKKRTIQMTGGNLLTKIYKLCKEDELSIKLWYDFDNNEMVFEVWQGLDRRDTQNTNTWAIFSRNFENILEDEYSLDTTKYCNFAYVAGEIEEKVGANEEGAEQTIKKRVVETVDRIKEGEERRELYVDARDLQKDEETTEAEYKQMLIERGIEKLNENNKVEMAEFNIDPLANLVYKKDFNLGDKVVYKNDQLGFNVEDRIIGITEAYEDGEKTIDVTFGEDYNIEKIKEMI